MDSPPTEGLCCATCKVIVDCGSSRHAQRLAERDHQGHQVEHWGEYNWVLFVGDDLYSRADTQQPPGYWEDLLVAGARLFKEMCALSRCDCPAEHVTP